MGEMAEITELNGKERFSAYLALPTAPATAAIIVIPEVFGINPGIKQKCDRLAADG